MYVYRLFVSDYCNRKTRVSNLCCRTTNHAWCSIVLLGKLEPYSCFRPIITGAPDVRCGSNPTPNRENRLWGTFSNKWGPQTSFNRGSLYTLFYGRALATNQPSEQRVQGEHHGNSSLRTTSVLEACSMVSRELGMFCHILCTCSSCCT